MPSVFFNSAVRDEAIGAIDYDTDTFYGMLVDASYVPNKDTHTRRSDVTGEITGTNYAAGGMAVGVTVAAVDQANDKVVITFASHNWPNATITNARGEVVYKRRGGVAGNDELVYYNDFGANTSSTAAAFTVAACTFTKQN